MSAEAQFRATDGTIVPLSYIHNQAVASLMPYSLPPGVAGPVRGEVLLQISGLSFLDARLKVTGVQVACVLPVLNCQAH